MSEILNSIQLITIIRNTTGHNVTIVYNVICLRASERNKSWSGIMTWVIVTVSWVVVSVAMSMTRIMPTMTAWATAIATSFKIDPIDT